MLTLFKTLTSLATALAICAAEAAQTAKVDLTGKWAFSVQTDAGAGSPTMTFKQDGEKLTGHYSGQLGEADLTGSVKGSDFTFAFSVDAQGTKLDVTYKGTIETKDSLKGTLSIAGLAEGSFTAKRQ